MGQSLTCLWLCSLGKATIVLAELVKKGKRYTIAIFSPPYNQVRLLMVMVATAQGHHGDAHSPCSSLRIRVLPPPTHLRLAVPGIWLTWQAGWPRA